MRLAITSSALQIQFASSARVTSVHAVLLLVASIRLSSAIVDMKCRNVLAVFIHSIRKLQYRAVVEQVASCKKAHGTHFSSKE